MRAATPLTGEVSGSKVAAVFDDPAMARAAARHVRDALALSDAQVQVLGPGERRPGAKLEPESHGIFRTMLVAHLRLGIAGAVVGLLVFAAFWFAGVAMFVNSPWLSAGVLIVFGAVGGMMLGGLVTLRPDHDPYVQKVYEAIGQGRHAVVVHVFDQAQRKRAVELLESRAGEVVATL